MIHELGEQLAGISWSRLGGVAQRKLLLCLLANTCVAVAGRSAMRLPRPRAGNGFALLDGGSTGHERDAAFYNAALMHARTQDDFHPIGNLHIATVVLPAVFARAERMELAGGSVPSVRFLDALAVGYSASTGLSRRFSPLSTPRGLRSTSLYASMGAAAAVAHLAGAGAQGIANTIGLASQSAFGTTQCWRDGSDEYQLHTGNAASQALLVADLTAAGVRAGNHALDGPNGFYPSLVGTTPRFDEIARDFDADAAINETVLKRYPVSGICQPVVRLSEQLASRLEGRPIDSVRIEMNEFEMNYPGTLNAGPLFRSFSDRLMSARFCAGSVLIEGKFAFDAFLREPSAALATLIACTDVQPAADLDTLSCRMRIATEDGGKVEGELLDGGNELAIDWDTIDEWGESLWKEAGRAPAGFRKLREVVLEVADSGFMALRGALVLP
jgi:2-methylcitrate dehydratase PrpD